MAPKHQEGHRQWGIYVNAPRRDLQRSKVDGTSQEAAKLAMRHALVRGRIDLMAREHFGIRVYSTEILRYRMKGYGEWS